VKARLLPFVVVVGALLLGGCGSGDRGVSASAGKLLNVQVDAIRASAAQADRSAAMQQLVLLRTSVDRLRSDGQLSASAADRIRRSADAVQSQLGLLPAPTTTSTTTTTTTGPSSGGSGEHRQKPRHRNDGHQQGGSNGD
jgi:hypothetical protein